MASDPPTIRIPLFPLQRVLFPCVPLNMQIFEPRYLRLIKESLAEARPFGVVPIIQGREVGPTPTIAPAGTLVTIRDWSQLPNGLLGVVVQGEQRLRVVNTSIDDDGLMIGEVFTPPDPVSPGGDHADLAQLLNFLARRFGVADQYLAGDMTASTLAWRLADLLPAAPPLKIALLDMDDVDARLAEVRGWVARLGQQH